MNRYGKRCVLYPRVSTEMQVDGYSLEGQKNMLTRFADREEMIVVDTYEDAGKSGKSIEGRPAFQKMLRDIEDGLDIDYILVYKLSRFGRNAADILNSLELVQSYGVNLICIEEGIDSSQTSGKLLISVLSAVAEIERENIIEQTMNGRREKARQGGWNGGFAPYGYTLEDNKLMIEETEAVAIRKIFELYTSSEIGLGGIANQLNLQGMRQIWALGIRDKKLLCIIKEMLKAPVVLPNGEKTYPTRGTPQGGILSPLLANIVLNELDWWIASQWEQMPTKTKFKTRSNAQGTEIKSHAYRALRRSRLKEMHAVRYADDFKIFCASHEDAVRAYKATELWLKDRLGLEISPDKSKVVNLKRQYSDFLGFKLKVRKKGKKYVVRSHMSDKAYKKAHDKVSEEVKELAHSSDDNAQFMQLQKYNSVVAGLHEYYCISTEVSHDFSRLAFSINKQLRNRLKGDLSKKGQLRNGFIKEKYGASRQMRFLHGRPVAPLGYVQPKNAQHKRKSINKYTVKGREQIHKNLAIDTATMLWLMRNPVKGRTIEYADNRISLYAAQYGICAVAGIPMDSHDIHCHHKVPVSNGGSDEYANLILVSKAVHILIHASSEPTIEKYLKSLNLDDKQIEKLNKLRTMAEMPPIIL